MEGDPISVATSLSEQYTARDLNEAGTRHQIIDVVLHDILSWPRNRTLCESFISPGYADYVLEKSSGEPLLILEAKKEGIYFELPQDFNKKKTNRKVSLKTLNSDNSICEAIAQVNSYCLHVGCEYGAITNGQEWIIFKTFSPNRRWDSLQAYVICGLDYFHSSHTEAINAFGFTAIDSEHSLRELFSSQSLVQRELYFPKENVTAYDERVNSNGVASILRPCAERFFGVLDKNDREFMDT